VDPETGKLDVDCIRVGTTKTQRDRLNDRFSKKEPMLEYMRLIILYSEENRKRKLLNCLKAKEIHYQGKTVKKVNWLF
jgi:hypothetical protein